MGPECPLSHLVGMRETHRTTSRPPQVIYGFNGRSGSIPTAPTIFP